MAETTNINADSPAVQKHIEIMQGVITRMAENSRWCKIWCVILVSAIFVLVALTEEPTRALIALAPAIALYILDSYYLALERGFRRSYSEFVERLHNGRATSADLYVVAPTGSTARGVVWAMFKSISTLPFYLAVFATIVLAYFMIS